ncbi:MAG: MFS transporter [Rhodospirillales bacterium]
MTDSMIFHFSLYGFLKNQQYFAPFILLAFLQMGLSFTLIGLLIGFRELLNNIFEIPSGAIADLLGRRKSLLFSFASYSISFAIMGTVGFYTGETSDNFFVFLILLLAMCFFALGDAFRSGTHKALIFTYLRIQGRTDERTKVYGFTRSWSQIGSALSVVLACLFVFYSDNYIWIFYFSIIPFLLNMINVGTYPPALDGDGRPENPGSREILGHLIESCRIALVKPDFRELILESMSFEGFFKAMKDYLQPILKMAALPLAILIFADFQLSDTQKSVILIGPIYVLIYLGSAVASRQSHMLAGWAGVEEKAAKIMWYIVFGLFVSLVPAFYFNVFWLMIFGLVFMHLLQNVWRPIFISRIDAHGDERKGATLLSIQSQAQSLATMAIAPLLGFSIDIVRGFDGVGEFWPIAVFGALISLVFIIPWRQRAFAH